MDGGIEGMKILVTGGAGFIGSHLIASLAKGNEVDILDNLSSGSMDRISGLVDGKNVRFHDSTPIRISDFCSGSDLIFHLGTASAAEMYRKNPMLVGSSISDIIGLLEYARRFDSKVVFASSSAVYNGVKTPHREDSRLKVADHHAEAKIESERLCELYSGLYGLDISAMRLFSVYGPGEESRGLYANPVSQFVWAVKGRKRPIIYGDGSQRRDFIFVGDVISALMKAKEHRGFGIFNVGTGKNFSLIEVLDKVCKQYGREVKPLYGSIPAKNYLVETLADTTKSSELLDFRAEVSLDQGISIMLGGKRRREGARASFGRTPGP